MALALKKPRSSEMCPPGFHVVRGHERICASGTRTWVDEHIRRNRGSIPSILLIENIHYLFWNSKKKYSKLKSIKEFEGKEDYDEAIQFWLDYWKETALPVADIDPLLIKAIIAVESSFRPGVPTKVKGSSASGLMQVTDQARRIMSGRPNKDGFREMKSEYLELSKADIFDPIVNIAAGIRWLAHKRMQVPKGNVKTIHNMLKNYYSWNQDGEEYAKKIEKLYEKSK